MGFCQCPEAAPTVGTKWVRLTSGTDMTTRVPDNGNDWRKFRVVPRLHPLRPLVLYFVYKGVEAEGLLDYQGRAGIISIVRWNLRPVIFGVDNPLLPKDPLLS